MAHILFVSYPRRITEYAPFAEQFRRFVDHLSATVAALIGHRDPLDEMCFIDATNIELGKSWPDEIQHAAQTCKICLAFYCPDYFISKWCGQEFELFRRRGIPIIPVWWIYAASVPPAIGDLQNVNNAFPREYRDKGLMRLMQGTELTNDYQNCVDALAARIVGAYKKEPEPPNQLELRTMPSAWDGDAGGTAPAAVTQNISRICFVYMARTGWGWKPYSQPVDAPVGALAQSLSAELQLRYEDMPCNASLGDNLRTRKAENVPTVLFTDPASLGDQHLQDGMRAYDDLYLLNCSALAAWPQGANVETTSEWDLLRRTLCPQKTSQPPPFHEWRSIFSQAELKNKAKAAIEGIRLSLLQTMLKPGSEANVRKAENPDLEMKAAATLLPLNAAPQLGPTTTTTGA
jgi:hypothetical protein